MRSSNHRHRQANNSFFGLDNSFILPSLMRSKYRNFPIGDVSLLIAQKITLVAKSYLSLMTRARLVCVSTSHNACSYGIVDAAKSPFVDHLVFTFSLFYNEEFPKEDVYVGALSNSVAVLGTLDDRNQFLSIGLSSTECSRFGLFNLQPSQLTYLYNTVGTIFKSLFFHKRAVAIDAQSIEDIHAQLSINSRLSLLFVLRRPYYEWPFFHVVWKFCPNLLSKYCINQYTTARWLEKYADTPIDYKDYGSQLVWSLDETSMLSLIQKSLLDFLQELNQPSGKTPSVGDYLAPCLIYNLIFTGVVGIPAFDELPSVYEAMLNAYSERNSELAQVFTPVDEVSAKLLKGSSSYVKILTSHIDLFSN